MLCERCKIHEANRHLTIVLDKQGEAAHHFCEVCFPEVEAERNKAYNTQSQSPTPLPCDLQSLTVREFVEIQERATRNGVDTPAFRQLLEKLLPLHDVMERLSFEAIALALDYLNKGIEPPGATLMAIALWLPKDSQRVAEHTDSIEKLIFRTFELRKALEYDPGKHGPFCMTLMMLLTPLSIRNPERYEQVMASLKARGAEATTDLRWNVIALVEESARMRKNSPPRNVG